MTSQAAPAASKGARRTPRRQVHPPRGLGDRLTSGRHRSRTTLDRAATRTAKALLAASISLLTVGLGVPATQAACPNEAVRLEQGFNHLPDCRGYEQVSPPYKEGYEDKGFISSDGTKAILEGSSIVAGTPGTSENVLGSDGYLDQRTPTGWKLTPLNAPLSEFVLQTLIAKEPDSGMTLWVQHLPSQSQAAKGLYAREPGADGKYKYLGPLNVPYAEEPKEPADWGEGTKSEKYYDKPLAATADYSHVVLQDSSSSQFWGFDKTTGVFSVYEYSGVNNEHPVLVGVNSPIKGADEPLVDTCGTQLGSGERGGSLYNSISADGESVFFTALACEGVPEEVWMRRHGALSAPGPAETIEISASGCTVACGAQASGVEFEGASENGSIIYMTSTQKLTNDAVDGTESGGAAVEESSCAHTAEGLGGCNLYVFDFDRPGAECQQAHQCLSLVAGGEVLGVAGIAEDGQRVYYVKRVGGTPELFVWDKASGESKLAAVLSYTGEEEEEAIWRRPFRHPVEVTGEDGRYLLFVSQTPGLTPDDHTSKPQLFEYDALTGELVRVSKGEGGYNEDGNAAKFGVSPESIETFATLLGEGGAGDFKSGTDRLNISSDGRTVLFKDKGRLSALASSAEKNCTSVYEFRTTGLLSEGAVHLVSDGLDTAAFRQLCGSLLAGGPVDATGDDVLIETADSLVPGDTDGGQEDVYDARVNGGFALPPSMLCSEPECGIPATSAGPAVAPASTSLTGPGNLPATPVAPATAKLKTTPPARAHQLAKALRACRKDHNKHKRKICETRARKKFETAGK